LAGSLAFTLAWAFLEDTCTVTLELACDSGTWAFRLSVAEPPLSISTLAIAEALVTFDFIFLELWKEEGFLELCKKECKVNLT